MAANVIGSVIAFVLFAALIGLVIVVVPKRQVARIFSATRAERLQMENAARQTIAQTIGGFLVLFGLAFTWQTVSATWRSTEIAREGQIAERFTKAVGQLGNDKNVAVRVGAIYALEKIATDDPAHYYWPVMELLTSFVRSPSPQWETTPESGGVRADFQAILTVIGRRILDPNDERVRNLDRAFREELERRVLDLREVSLEGLNLGTLGVMGKAGVHLKNVDFEGAKLQRAKLSHAILENVKLEGAHLEQGRLQDATFVNACLIRAYLTKRSGGRLGTDLTRAKLIAADLRQAHFDEGTILEETDLSGAKLAEVTGVTPERLKTERVIMNQPISWTDASPKPWSCP